MRPHVRKHLRDILGITENVLLAVGIVAMTNDHVPIGIFLLCLMAFSMVLKPEALTWVRKRQMKDSNEPIRAQEVSELCLLRAQEVIGNDRELLTWAGNMLSNSSRANDLHRQRLEELHSQVEKIQSGGGTNSTPSMIR